MLNVDNRTYCGFKVLDVVNLVKICASAMALLNQQIRPPTEIAQQNKPRSSKQTTLRLIMRTKGRFLIQVPRAPPAC